MQEWAPTWWPQNWCKRTCYPANINDLHRQTSGLKFFICTVLYIQRITENSHIQGEDCCRIHTQHGHGGLCDCHQCRGSSSRWGQGKSEDVLPAYRASWISQDRKLQAAAEGKFWGIVHYVKDYPWMRSLSLRLISSAISANILEFCQTSSPRHSDAKLFDILSGIMEEQELFLNAWDNLWKEARNSVHKTFAMLTCFSG